MITDILSPDMLFKAEALGVKAVLQSWNSLGMSHEVLVLIMITFFLGPIFHFDPTDTALGTVLVWNILDVIIESYSN